MSELRADTITASDGTSPVTLTKQSAAKAWVNLNGTGTIAIIDSDGVTSISDNGTGDYSVTLTNSMSDANYVTVASSARANDTFATNVYTNNATGAYVAPTSSAFRFCSNKGYGLGGTDNRSMNAVTHGDLA
jgi:hypothetical protein